MRFSTTNAERQKQGLPALKRNSTANKYARSKSLEMLNLNYFDHKSPNNGYIQDIAKKDGWKYSRIGENIYTMTGGQASSVSGASITNSWMNSEGHRKNILNSGYTEIGIGVTFRNGKLYATQIFYTPL
ncbi:MAG: CAP domain-containing protein [Clostridium paraputrificum]